MQVNALQQYLRVKSSSWALGAYGEDAARNAGAHHALFSAVSYRKKNTETNGNQQRHKEEARRGQKAARYFIKHQFHTAAARVYYQHDLLAKICT